MSRIGTLHIIAKTICQVCGLKSRGDVSPWMDALSAVALIAIPNFAAKRLQLFANIATLFV
ncbi:MAG: hypothetical protein ABSA75_06320 [Candidatus Bathyarchaeia archaeon]